MIQFTIIKYEGNQWNFTWPAGLGKVRLDNFFSVAAIRLNTPSLALHDKSLYTFVGS